MTEEMKPIDPITAAMLMGKTPEPCEPMIEIPCKALTRLMDVVEFGDQLERVEKDRLLGQLKDMLAEEQSQLWVIHSVGPNELHPMISKEAAERHVAELSELLKGMSDKFGCRFDVIPSPFSPLEHFEILAEETIEQRDALQEYVKELKQSAEATDATLDKFRAAGLSIDGDNAYKRDLLDCAIGAMALGMQNNNPPPAGHWCQQFWDIGRAEGEMRDKLVAQVTAAARDVLAERQRQVTVEGYHGFRDSHYISYELSKAARAYIEVSWHALSNGPPCAKPKSWPWMHGFKWSDGRTMLVKAGALILAEIERIDRASGLIAEQPAIEAVKLCAWKRDEDTGAYATGCGVTWHFSDGGEPEENGALFCHHCGGQIAVERRQLIAYQVGDNDIVAAYDPAGAIKVLNEYNGWGNDYDEDEVDLVSDKVLDNTEAFDIDEGKTITLEKTLRQELAELTEPAYLHGWE